MRRCSPAGSQVRSIGLMWSRRSATRRVSLQPLGVAQPYRKESTPGMRLESVDQCALGDRVIYEDRVASALRSGFRTSIAADGFGRGRVRHRLGHGPMLPAGSAAASRHPRSRQRSDSLQAVFPKLCSISSPKTRSTLARRLASARRRRRDAVSDVCARWPRFLDAWSRLGQLVRATARPAGTESLRTTAVVSTACASQDGEDPVTSVAGTRPMSRFRQDSKVTCVAAARPWARPTEAQCGCGRFLYQLDPGWDRRSD